MVNSWTIVSIFFIAVSALLVIAVILLAILLPIFLGSSTTTSSTTTEVEESSSVALGSITGLTILNAGAFTKPVLHSGITTIGTTGTGFTFQFNTDGTFAASSDVTAGGSGYSESDLVNFNYPTGIRGNSTQIQILGVSTGVVTLFGFVNDPVLTYAAQQATTDGLGSGAVFDVRFDTGTTLGATIVTVTSGGSNYSVGEIITLTMSNTTLSGAQTTAIQLQVSSIST